MKRNTLIAVVVEGSHHDGAAIFAVSDCLRACGIPLRYASISRAKIGDDARYGLALDAFVQRSQEHGVQVIVACDLKHGELPMELAKRTSIPIAAPFVRDGGDKCGLLTLDQKVVGVSGLKYEAADVVRVMAACVSAISLLLSREPELAAGFQRAA